jgi:hypothetical protein
VENEVWQHNRLPQGWSASLSICQRAVLWTFRDEVLFDFMEKHSLTPEQFPMKSFRDFVVGFVDDLAIHSKKNHPMPKEIHFLCIEAVFYALESAGWLVKLEVSTFMNPDFVFLGLKWNLKEKSSKVQNDRVDAILNHQPPRSMPELASGLATLQYYRNFLPLMKRVAIPLYKIVKEGKFKWTKVECESYSNLLYLMGLQIRNYIFDPTKPLMLMADTSAVESSLLIFQWDPDTLSLQIVTTKSILLTTALRRQAPVHREAHGVDRVMDLAKSYLFQTSAPVNYLFDDASSISYIARNRPFSSFLQTLSETLSMYPSLVVIHLPGRALWYADILSRQFDHVAMTRTDTMISEDQAKLIPSLQHIKSGAILSNTELLKLFSTPIGPEITDVSDSDFKYIQRVDWSMYVNPHQYFTSEREYLLGALIGNLDPELSLNFPTLKDIFRIKESGSKLKTKAQKLAFISQIAESLRKLPYNSHQLNLIMNFLKKKSVEYRVSAPGIEVTANYVRHSPRTCLCQECHELAPESVHNSINNAFDFVKGLREPMMSLKIPGLDILFGNLDRLSCPVSRSTLSQIILDKAIRYCTSSTDFWLDDSPLFVFKYNLGNKNLSIQFEKNRVKIYNNEQIHLVPGEILEIPIGFVSDIQALPDLNSEIPDDIAVAPCVQFIPHLNVPTLHLANCTESTECYVRQDTVLLSFEFKTVQTLGIHRKLEDIFADNQSDRNIINIAFLQYTGEAISKIAVESYKKDIQSFKTSTTRRRGKKQIVTSEIPTDDVQPKKSKVDATPDPLCF